MFVPPEQFPNNYKVFLDPDDIYNLSNGDVDIGSGGHMNLITLMQVLLREQGPLVAVMAYDTGLFTLKKGQVYKVTGDIVGHHAVEIVGYHKPNDGIDNAFWVIKNSWGKELGRKVCLVRMMRWLDMALLEWVKLVLRIGLLPLVHQCLLCKTYL